MSRQDRALATELQQWTLAFHGAIWWVMPASMDQAGLVPRHIISTAQRGQLEQELDSRGRLHRLRIRFCLAEVYYKVAAHAAQQKLSYPLHDCAEK